MPDNQDFFIRPCFEQDLDQVRLIYAHHVETGTGTFEEVAPTTDEMNKRWSHVVTKGWPWLVATPRRDFTRVIGFAYAGQFRDRSAYAKTFEDSVYVAPNFQRKGVGAALLKDVIGLLRHDGAREVVALIGDAQNLGSIELHKRLGFRHIGTFSAVGRKFDRWLDVVLMQHSLRAD